MTPVFLLSLPRSGSTFVQRVLATHPQISTAPEPWILLPLIYASRKQGVFAEYGHSEAIVAIEDFCARLANGRGDYDRELREFAIGLYRRCAADGARYFLDKTPRYHLIVDDLLRLFPDARFIVLWRHPLAVVASMITTWGAGRWNLYQFKIDLYRGLANLVAAQQTMPGRMLAVRYEDLLTAPDRCWPRLFAHLGLEYDRSVLDQLPKVRLEGRVGDQVGSAQYATASVEPLGKWRSVMRNPLRKAWCRRYLRWIGAPRLAVMGYRLEDLLAEIDAVPFDLAGLGSDVWRVVYGTVFCALEFRIMKAKYARGAQPLLLAHS